MRRGHDLARLFIDHWINVKLQAVLKHSPERFKNSAFEIQIIFLVKNFEQTRHAHHEADHPIRITRKITSQPVILAEFRNQNRSSERAQNVYPLQKVGMI